MPSRSKSTSGTDASPQAALLEIARVGRAHGLRGEVVVHPISNRDERFAVGSVLVTAVGERAVTRSRRDSARWLLGFSGIDDRDGASTLTGTTLYAAPLDDSDELWVHELCGSAVVDQHGTTVGVVASVIANPAADLLELDTGHLVPLTFVVRSDVDTVYVEAPDGLFDLIGG